MEVTLITGASSGLGKEFAKIYAKENNNLLLVSSNLERLNNVKKELEEINNSITIDVFAANLSIREELNKVYDYIVNKQYEVTRLINNAGFGDQKEFIKMDIDYQMDMVNVTCNAPMFFMNKLLPDMIKNDKGEIINVSSIAAFYPGPYMCTYHASKAFLWNISEAINYEIRNTHVKLLTLCPGPFNSNFVNKAHNYFAFEKKKPIEASEVATIAYNGLKKNKKVIIIGFGNKVEKFGSRFVGRKTILKTAAKSLVKGGKCD